MGARVRCEECGEAYVLPDEFRESLEGKHLECARCSRSFAPFPDKKRKRLFGGAAEIVPIDLTPYREEASGVGGTPLPRSEETVPTEELPAPPEAPAPPPAARKPIPPDAEAGDETVPDRRVVRLASERRLTAGPSIFLVGVDGAASGRTFKVQKARTLIGRSHGDLQLGDTKASRTHAQLDVTENGQILLRDLASTNGTTVNGILITVARLESGSVIGIGDSKLKLVVKV